MITDTLLPDVKLYDVLSTDGGRVVEIVRNGDDFTITVIAHGVEKVGQFKATDTLPIWKSDPEPDGYRVGDGGRIVSTSS